MSGLVLVTATPRIAATGAAATVRLAGGGIDRPYYYGGQHFRAGVVKLPRFKAALAFEAKGWTGGAVPATAALEFMPGEAALLSELAACFWRDAALTIETGPEAGPFVTLLTGRVEDGAAVGGKLVLTIADLASAIGKPMLTARFAGTGGVEGSADATGRLKRRSWGRCFNIEGRILDKANNVWEFGDPAFAWQQWAALRDKGREYPIVEMAWQGSAAATLAALAASSPAAGGAVVSRSIACAKPWTQPAGPITADIRGEVGAAYVETPAEIAGRVLAAAGGPAIANTAAAAALRPAVAGLHIGTDSESAAEALDRLLHGVSLLWVLEPAGTIRLREWSFASPGETIVAHKIERRRYFAPIRSRRLGYQRAERTHGDGELAVVLLASDAVYPDGTPVSALQPATSGATRNDDGANMIPAPVDLSQATFSGNAMLSQPEGATGRPANRHRIQLISANALGRFGPPMPCTPGETLYLRYVVASDVSTSDTCNASVAFFDAAGSLVTATNLGSQTSISGTAALGGFVERNAAFTVPAGAAQCQVYVERPTALVLSSFYAGEPYLGRTQPGATRNDVLYSDFAPGAPRDGAFWADTSVIPTVLRMRTGGAWQAVANLPTQGFHIGVANGATRNVVTRASSAPASPVDGDIWIDTSVTPNVLRTRLGGAWGASSNLVTQGEDIGVENGADVTAIVDGLTDVIIRCDHTGAALAGELTRNVAYRLMRNGVSIGAGLDWDWRVISGQVNGSTAAASWMAISGAGAVVLAITSLANDENLIEVRAVQGAFTRTKQVRVAKERAAPPSGGGSSGGGGGSTGGTSASDSSLASITNPSHAVVSDDLIVTVGSGGSVALTASFDISSNATGETPSEVRAIFRWWNGSAWVDVGTETASDPDCTRYYDNELGGGFWLMLVYGSVSIGISKTGLTPGASEKFRLYARVPIGGEAGTYTLAGSASAQG